MKKRLLLAGFPKSGNSWLGYMLSYLLSAKYTDLHVPDKPPTGQKWIMDLISGKLAHVSEFEEVNKTHKLPEEIPDLKSYDNIIHIIRDPRDVAVSYFFFKWYNLPIFLKKMYMLYIIRFPLFRYFIWKMNILKTAQNWNLHSLSWLSHNVYLIRYEDLVKNASQALKTICKKLNVERDEILIKDSIEKFSFDNLSGGRKSGKEDKYHFFRKGIVGDYQNHFDRVDDWLIHLFCKKTMKLFYYN